MKKLIVLSISMLFALAVQALDFTVDNLKYSTNADDVSAPVSGYVSPPVGQVEISTGVTDGAKSHALNSIGSQTSADSSSKLVSNSMATDADNYIIDTAMFNVISTFTITEEMETLFKADPFNEARMFSMAPDPYAKYASFFAAKLDKAENTAYVENILTQKVLPKDSVHYFQFKFPREYFNTQKYKFTLIFATKKRAPSFRLSVRTVNMKKDTTHIQYLYPLQKDGVTRLNSVPVAITNPDSIRRLATEIFFAKDYTGLLDVPTTDKQGNVLTPTTFNFFSVTFEPFQIFDFKEEVWLRFELGSVLVPMRDAKTTTAGKYIFLNSFYFDNGASSLGGGADYEIKLQKAGTLLTAIGADNLKNVSKLNISGPMNGTDILTIKTMLPQLQILDMENAMIVSGGVAYSDNGSLFTADNQIGENMFSNMLLKSVKMPSGITSIGDYAFSGCSGLTSITIPSGVTSIGNSAFENCRVLSSITIPSGVISIGNSAFENCRSLLSITVPSRLTFIGNSTFKNCRSLTSMTIPSGVTSIGDSAFFGCSGVPFMTIPSGVTSIDAYAFSGCSGVSSMTIPSGVTSIANGVFSGCSGLTSISIPSVVTSIGAYAFSGCSKVTSMTIPSIVTFIGAYAFSGCSGLTAITIPSGITSIEDGTFQDCKWLTSISIPSGVTSIGAYAFAGCGSELGINITIPSSVTSIGAYAFAGSSISFITIPSGVTSIGDGTFLGCSNLTSITIPSGVTSIGNFAFSGCNALPSITLPSSVASIGDGAFYNCSLRLIICQGSTPASASAYSFHQPNVQGILVVPQSAVTAYSLAIGWSDFKNILEQGTDYDVTLQEAGTLLATIGADNLKKVSKLTISGPMNGTDILTIRTKLPQLQMLDMENATIVSGGVAYSDNGSLFTADNQIGKSMFSDMLLKSLIIPSGVTSIGDDAFSGCSGVPFMTIPSGVTSIANGVFSGCSGLTSISIPSSVTSIGDGAFYSCGALTSITLPSGVTSIGNDTFFGCSALTSITLPSDVTSIGDYTFGYCSALTSITLPSSVTSIGFCAFSGCSSLTSFEIPSGVISIDPTAFSRCGAMKEFIVMQGNQMFKTIDGVLFSKDLSVIMAFPNAKSTNYTIPSDVTSIGDCAFYECSGLTSIALPSSVTSIGDCAFYECSGLTSITLPSSVTSIGGSAFSGCSALTSIAIPSGVTSIGDYTFGYCSGLTSITLPSGVTSIGDDAFSGCSGLKEIHSLNLIPPIVTGRTFTDFSTSSCILYVPQGKRADYAAAIGWGDFKNIVEENVAGEDLIKQNATLKVYTATDAIVIEGAEYGEEITICTESGALVQRFKAVDDVIRVTVPQNAVYLIQTASQTVKVAL